MEKVGMMEVGEEMCLECLGGAMAKAIVTVVLVVPDFGVSVCPVMLQLGEVTLCPCLIVAASARSL